MNYYDPSGYSKKANNCDSKDVNEGTDNSGYTKVYRGTGNTSKLMIYDETGQLMSDATRRAYMETGSIDEALKLSDSAHSQWLDIWGDQNTYVQAHGEWGSELSSAFGIVRTMMSVTTDPKVAQYFAGPDGVVFEGLVPNSQLIPQTLSGSGESEYLIKFLMEALDEIK